MYREKVGVVTEQEKLLMQGLYERRLALSELLPALSGPDVPDGERDKLYEKLVSDMGKVNLEMQRLWTDMSRKYEWKSAEKGHWTLDFRTNEVFLVDIQEQCCEG